MNVKLFEQMGWTEADDACLNCRSSDFDSFIRGSLRDKEGNYIRAATVSCDRCNIVKPTAHLDALGNRVVVTDDVIGKYSYATGEPILSKRQYAETLRRKGLAQK